MMLPRPQDLNVPILELARDMRGLCEADLHARLAFAASVVDPTPADRMDFWRFSAIINIARKRLVRNGLLRQGDDRRLTITARGELFLSQGLTRVHARSRQSLDVAVLASLESAYRRSA